MGGEVRLNVDLNIEISLIYMLMLNDKERLVVYMFHKYVSLNMFPQMTHLFFLTTYKNILAA